MCIKNLFLDYDISKLRGGLELSGQCFSSRGVSVRQWAFFSVWRPLGLPQPVERLLLASSRKVGALLNATQRTGHPVTQSYPARSQ